MRTKQTRNEKAGQKRGTFFSAMFSKSAETKNDAPDRLEFWLKIAFLVVLIYFLVLDVYLFVKNTSWMEPGAWREVVSGTVFERDAQDVPDNPESKAMHQILDADVRIRQIDQPEIIIKDEFLTIDPLNGEQ